MSNIIQCIKCNKSEIEDKTVKFNCQLEDNYCENCLDKNTYKCSICGCLRTSPNKYIMKNVKRLHKDTSIVTNPKKSDDWYYSTEEINISCGLPCFG